MSRALAKPSTNPAPGVALADLADALGDSVEAHRIIGTLAPHATQMRSGDRRILQADLDILRYDRALGPEDLGRAIAAIGKIERKEVEAAQATRAARAAQRASRHQQSEPTRRWFKNFGMAAGLVGATLMTALPLAGVALAAAGAAAIIAGVVVGAVTAMALADI